MKPALAVDYGPSALWITWLAPLWITHAGACCGLGRGGDVGAGFAPTPQGRTESCTLHILADVLLMVLTGEENEETRHGYADERAELRSS